MFKRGFEHYGFRLSKVERFIFNYALSFFLKINIMKLSVTPKEINLKKDSDGTYSYRINGDLSVSNISTIDEALKDAENKLMKLVRQIIKK